MVTPKRFRGESGEAYEIQQAQNERARACWHDPGAMAVPRQVDAGRATRRTDLGEGGIIGDRAYALIDTETGKVATIGDDVQVGVALPDPRCVMPSGAQEDLPRDPTSSRPSSGTTGSTWQVRSTPAPVCTPSRRRRARSARMPASASPQLADLGRPQTQARTSIVRLGDRALHGTAAAMREEEYFCDPLLHARFGRHAVVGAVADLAPAFRGWSKRARRPQACEPVSQTT
jgi:hypothetical protein